MEPPWKSSHGVEVVSCSQNVQNQNAQNQNAQNYNAQYQGYQYREFTQPHESSTSQLVNS